MAYGTETIKKIFVRKGEGKGWRWEGTFSQICSQTVGTKARSEWNALYGAQRLQRLNYTEQRKGNTSA